MAQQVESDAEVLARLAEVDPTRYTRLVAAAKAILATYDRPDVDSSGDYHTALITMARGRSPSA